MKLYDYQVEAVEFAKQKKYSINSFVMGLGKTVVALGLAREVSKKTLIVCPKFLLENWREEVLKFGTSGYVQFINYAKLSNEKLDEFDLVIVDEAHYVKNVMARRSDKLYNAIAQNPPKYLIMLTATPMKNNVGEIFNLLRFCNIHHKDRAISKFKNLQFRFNNKFMELQKFKIKGRNVSNFKGFKNREEFKELAFKYVYKKKLSDVYLPPAVHTQLNVGDFSSDNDIESLMLEFDKEHFMTLKASMALKLSDFTIEYVKEMREQCIIFTDHIKSAAKIAEKLGVPMITGSVQVEERNKIIDDFKSGKVKYLVATYKSAGMGLSLINCRYMIFNDLPFVPADIDQARGRISRVTQERTCFYYYVGLSKMYFKLFQTLKKKAEVLKIALSQD